MTVGVCYANFPASQGFTLKIPFAISAFDQSSHIDICSALKIIYPNPGVRTLVRFVHLLLLPFLLLLPLLSWVPSHSLRKIQPFAFPLTNPYLYSKELIRYQCRYSPKSYATSWMWHRVNFKPAKAGLNSFFLLLDWLSSQG